MSYKITNIATGEAYEPFYRGSWQHVRSGVRSANFTALLRGIEDDQTGDDKTMVLAAVRWEDDEFYPSPRPLRKTLVSSTAPPRLGAGDAGAQGNSSESVTVERDRARAPLSPPRPNGDRAKPVEPDTDPLPVGPSAGRRRLFGGRRKQ